MKKQIRTIISMLLVLCLVSISAFAAQSTEQEIMPRYTYISDIITGLHINSAGKACCNTNLTIYSELNSAKIDMELQRDDGSGWEYVRSWTVTDNGWSIDVVGEWYVAPGYDYQVESTIYVYNSNGRLIERTTTHSPIWTY